MSLTLRTVKIHCHIDGNDEDELLAEWMDSAEDFIMEQSGKTKYIGTDGTANEPIRERPLFQTAVKQLVAYWVDNREAASVNHPTDVPFSVDSLIAHFKYGKEYG